MSTVTTANSVLQAGFRQQVFFGAGLTQTVRSIHAASLVQTGLPGQITRVTVKGVPVAFVAFAPYDYTASLLDLPAARALISCIGVRMRKPS